MSDVRRILVVKLSAFGDLLHAVPIAHRLAEHYQCPIDWVTQPEYVELVKLHRDVDRVIAFPRNGTISKFGAFRKELRRESYDLAVDLQGLAKSGLVLGMVKAKRKIACPVSREGAHWFANERPPPTGAVHALDRLRDTLRYLEVETDPVTYPMEWPPADTPEGQAPHIGLAIRSRWPGKDWSQEHFTNLAKRLIQKNDATIHFLGGPQDHELAQEMVTGVGVGAHNQCGRGSLAELGGFLQQLNAVVSNDSGPMHLAAAVGTPLVALFGPTDPTLTGPWGDAFVLRPEPGTKGYPDHRSYKKCDSSYINQLTVDQVYAAVLNALA